jgi:hypothetical protein
LRYRCQPLCNSLTASEECLTSQLAISGKGVRAPWSESLSLNNEVNICLFVCLSVCPPTNYHENSD